MVRPLTKYEARYAAAMYPASCLSAHILSFFSFNLPLTYYQKMEH